MRTRVAIVAATVLLPLAGAATYATGVAAGGAGPTREVLAQVDDPRGADGRTLSLSRVTIPPRTALGLHRHPGNQVAYLQRGTLTYTVRSGAVKVYRGEGGASRLVRTIRAGDTGVVRAGEWLVERPRDVHIGANRGDRPVVVLLASLFTTGSPASIPVEPGR